MDSFEAWHVAGEEYAAEHPELDLWPFQIKAMASDWAWRWEGIMPTPELKEKAYADWISGNNPYSVHTVPKDGYDDHEQWRRLKIIAEDQYRDFGRSKGIEEWQLDRFVHDMHVELYFRESQAEPKYQDWIQGSQWSQSSPYYVPLDPENIAERVTRRAELLERHPMENWMASIYFPRASEYGRLEDLPEKESYTED